MKHCLIFAFAFITACQRPANTAVEQTAKEAPKAEKSPLEEKAKKYDLNYDLKSAPSKKEGIQEMSLKDKLNELDYKSFYESGYQKHNLGDFSGAISDFNKCIALNPDYSDAWNFRGMSKYKSGDRTGACSDWKKAGELGYVQALRMIDEYCK